MINSLSVSGLKGFIERVCFPCARFTVLTGGNSSGKSTLLQTLLLLKQTVEQPPYRASWRLNGPYAYLGTGHIISSDQAQLRIDWYHSHNSLAAFEVVVERVGDEAQIVSFTGPDGSELVRRPPTKSEHRCISAEPGELFCTDSRQFLVRGIITTAELVTVEKYTVLQESQLQQKCREIISEYLRDLLAAALELFSRDESESALVPLSSSDDYESARLAIRCLDRDDLPNAVAYFHEIRSVREDIARYPSQIPTDLLEYIPERMLALVKTLGPHAPADLLLDGLAALDTRFTRAEHQLLPLKRPDKPPLDLLLHSVLYLGPLRSDPQIVYPDVVVRDPQNMGSKGEQFVSLLYYSGERIVEDVDPRTLDHKHARRSLTLKQALNSWIAYLGVGHDVLVAPAPPYGLSIKIRDQHDAPYLYLTNVGVGASQLLPILTLCLLARADSILILEQPELHLHPAVQSRLADFLISLTALGKQLIVETHSEHLVNRVRLHIARGTLTKSSVSIAFLERDGGGTRLMQVKIDDSGFLETWPTGFFDETEQVLLELSDAIAQK